MIEAGEAGALDAQTRTLANRINHVRALCDNCLNHDPRGSDRYWLAESVLNILNGNIDDQIA